MNIKEIVKWLFAQGRGEMSKKEFEEKLGRVATKEDITELINHLNKGERAEKV